MSETISTSSIAALCAFIVYMIVRRTQKKDATAKTDASSSTEEEALTPEEEEVIKTVQLVKFKCKYAENFVRETDSDIPEIADNAKKTVRKLYKNMSYDSPRGRR